MASQHLLLLVFVANLAVVLSSELTRQNDLVIGTRVDGDYLIQRSFITKNASWLGKKLTYTKTFVGDGVSTITQVRALDQNEKGHGATVRIIAGGVDHVYVTVRLESLRYRRIDFVVEVYGKKKSEQIESV